MAQEERRGERRFPLRQPASLRFVEDNAPDPTAITENVSAHGALLQSETEMPVGARAEITLLLPEGPPLKASGRILRAERSHEGGPYLVAMHCNVPFRLTRS
jgi:PilZ domain